MKHLIVLLVAAALHAQTVVHPPAVTLNNEAVTAVQSWMVGQTNGTQTTLSADIDAVATAVTVADGAGLSNKVLLIDSEAITVTARTGGGLTVTRASLGTVSATHAKDAKVRVLKYTSVRDLTKEIVLAKLREVVEISPTATVLTKRAAQKTIDDEIAAAKVAAVQ